MAYMLNYKHFCFVSLFVKSNSFSNTIQYIVEGHFCCTPHCLSEIYLNTSEQKSEGHYTAYTVVDESLGPNQALIQHHERLSHWIMYKHGTHFFNDFSIIIWIEWKISFA